MNKRQKKKRWKEYHKQFCRKDTKYDWCCPNCGWDSLDADEEIHMGRIVWQYGSFYDYSFEVEYKCPVCGTVFSYVDGT